MQMRKAYLQTVDFGAAASRLHIERVASAFEVPNNQVLDDWAFVNGVNEMDEHDVIEHLRRRHAWDPSVAPYYVSWLKRSDGCR